MDRPYIDDHHVVARYLADQLPDAEREAFEAYYLEHPHMLQELEAAARFKVGLARLEESGKLGPHIQAPRWHRPLRTLAIAASVLIAALAIALWFAAAPSSQPVLLAERASLTSRLGSPLPVASTHTVLRTRSLGPDARIELPAAPRAIELRVLPDAESAAGTYRVSLSPISTDGSSQPGAQIPLGSVGGLATDAQGFVRVYLNSARLAAGLYRLRISADRDGAPADSFIVRVSAPDAD